MNTNRFLKNTFNIFLGIAITLFIALLFLSIRCKILNIPSFIFGKSYIKIASNSMENSGYKKDELIVINLTNPSKFKIGDNVAFYYNTSLTPANLTEPANAKNFPTYNLTHMFGFNLHNFEKVSKTKRIVFHKIIDIKKDSSGELWFQTWGTNNTTNGTPNPDTNWTNAKYIIGRYSHKSIFNSFGKHFANPAVLYFALCTISISALTLSLIIDLNSYILILKLKQRKILISNKRITHQLFKHLTLSEKADIIDSIKPDELLIFKNKAFKY